MKKQFSNIFWGMMLIAGGGLALAQTQGYLTEIAPIVWIFVFAGISLLSLIFYIINGIENWTMLFPVGIFAALSFLLSMSVNGAENPAFAAPLFLGFGLPFMVAFLLNRAKNWWALIPIGVSAFLTLTMLVVDSFANQFIGSILLFCLALAFGSIYIIRQVRWAIIVAYIMLITGFLPLLSMSDRHDLTGVIVLLAIALPFFIVYMRSPERRWWALIPAGIMTTTGIVVAISLLPGLPEPDTTNRILTAITYLGIAATFSVIWLRHHKSWAMFFIVLTAALAVLQGVFGTLQYTWPLLMVLGGLALLYKVFRTGTKGLVSGSDENPNSNQSF